MKFFLNNSAQEALNDQAAPQLESHQKQSDEKISRDVREINAITSKYDHGNDAIDDLPNILSYEIKKCTPSEIKNKVRVLLIESSVFNTLENFSSAIDASVQEMGRGGFARDSRYNEFQSNFRKHFDFAGTLTKYHHIL